MTETGGKARSRLLGGVVGILVVILGIYVALFARGVGGDYVWDDVGTIANSGFFDRPLGQALRATEHERMDEALTAMRGVAFGHESYRPVNVATHWIDVRSFGRRPAPMHVHSLLWGALGIVLAQLLATRLLGDARWATVVTAVFAIHPLHVEPYVYISARADLVSGAFVLFSAWLLTRADPVLDPGGSSPATGSPTPATRALRPAWIAAAAVTTLLGLFAKESAMALPVALLALSLALGRARAWWVALVVLFGTVLAHFPLRQVLVPAAPLASPARLGPTFARLPGIVAQYLEAMLAPLSISNARPLDPVLTKWGWPLLALVVAGIGIGMGLRIRRRRSGVAKTTPATDAPAGPSPHGAARDLALAAAGVLWAAAFLAPAALAVGTLGALADRYAYVAIFGFGLTVAALLRQAASRHGLLRGLPLARAAVLAVTVLWASVCLFVDVREVGFWANNRALYTHAVLVEPDSAIAQYRLGVLLGGERRWPDAVAAFTRAADLKQRLPPDVAPTEDRVLNNLGVAHLNLGQTDDAERAFRRAIERSGNVSYRAWFNLAELAWARGDRPGACRALAEALAISPKYRAALASQAARCATPAATQNVAP